MGPIGALAYRYRRLRLQTRFALHVILLVAVLFALVIPTVLLIQESVILGTARDNGRRLVTIFAFSSVQAVVAEDFRWLCYVKLGFMWIKREADSGEGLPNRESMEEL